MSVIVLLPGAWHTARCWERVVPLLAQLGHRVLTPNLMGVGDQTPAASLSLALWTDQIAALVSREQQPVILAGHSRGGIVLSAVAERVPDRIACLVYIAGILLPDGGSIATHGPDRDRWPKTAITVGDDGMGTLRADVARDSFLNTTAAEWTDRSLSGLVPEPVWIFGEPIRITRTRFGSVRRAYIETRQDNGVPLELQRRWQAEWPCDPVITLEGDHSPFYSDPSGLADAIARIADRAEDPSTSSS